MTEPTEMSSSPAIIRRPTGSAMMPTSAAMFSQLEKPGAPTKRCAAERREEYVDDDQPNERSRPPDGVPADQTMTRNCCAAVRHRLSPPLDTCGKNPACGLARSKGRANKCAAASVATLSECLALAPARVASMLDVSTTPGPVRISRVGMVKP